MSALEKQVGGDHYKDFPIQPIVFIEQNKLPFLEASILKRVCRHNRRGGKGSLDIQKIIHEAELILELRYNMKGGDKEDRVEP